MTRHTEKIQSVNNLVDEIEVVSTCCNSEGRPDYKYDNAFGLTWDKWFDSPEERDKYWEKLQEFLTKKRVG